jgi:hypothetical protein
VLRAVSKEIVRIMLVSGINNLVKKEIIQPGYKLTFIK